jgi:hypothetical protein
MRPFLISAATAIVLAIAAAILLNGMQKRAYEAYSTSATRVSNPGYNLVGSEWSGEPSDHGS